MDGVSEWLISLSPLNNGIKPLASCRLALGGGRGRSGGLEWGDKVLKDEKGTEYFKQLTTLSRDQMPRTTLT